MNKTNAKQQLLEAGAELIHLNGYNNTGISDILKKAGIPKGSFYFYFKNKEDYGLQLIDFYSHFFRGMAEEHLTGETTPKVEQIRNFFGAFRHVFEEKSYTCGCPIGNLSQEMGDVNDNFRQNLLRVYEETMVRPIKEALEAAMTRGELSRDHDPKELADFILNAWQGALIKMKLTRDLTPYNTFEQVMYRTLQR